MLRLLFPILKKFSLKIFFRLEQLKQNQRTFGSVDGDFIKSNSLRASSAIWASEASEASLARTRERGSLRLPK